MPNLKFDGTIISARVGDTIVEAMQRAAVPFAFSCYAGDCGDCKCEFVSGDIVEVHQAAPALTDAERARSIVLGCRVRIQGDVEIRRIDDGDQVAHPPRTLDCRVVSIDDLTHDIKRFRLAIRHGGPFAFTAGQYARVTFAPDIFREYSMANPPHDPVLEFHVRRTANGLASNHIFTRLAADDPVQVDGPLGACYLRERHTGPILLAAGGSGMAPMFSILESALQLGLTQPIRLYFGVRDARDFYGRERLDELTRRHPHFAYQIALSAAPQPVAGYRTGFLSDVIIADWPSLQVEKAYLAGPPVMVESVSDLLQERGIPLRDIHADAFYTEADKARLQAMHAK
ncbi:MAG: FAD-binding oxidoreductase [Betaproteobacteria bacterium]